jgi:alpha-L-rhamnosidase
VHASTIVELPSGELLSAFFGGSEEGDPDVEIWLARKPPDGTWTTPVSVADGALASGTRVPAWNPVLFQKDDGELMLFYKLGPSPGEWWGMTRTSTDGGRTWGAARRLPDGLIGPVKNKPVRLADGTIVAGSSTEDDGWQVHIERSTDGAKTWDRIGPLEALRDIGAIQPALMMFGNGRIAMYCRTQSEHGFIAESWSDDAGRTWTPLSPTVLPNNNSGFDITTLKDGRQLIVYNHSTREQDGMGHKGRGILNVAISDDGRTWSAALVLEHVDAPGRQFSYPAVIQGSDGLVHVVYTWHREGIKHGVLDPATLQAAPMPDGRWPTEGAASLNVYLDANKESQ